MALLKVWCSQLRFEKIILRANHDRSRGNLFIRRFRQDHHRRVRRGRMHLIEGLQTVTIRQNQFQHDQVVSMVTNFFQSRRQLFCLCQFKTGSGQQMSRSGIFFDQQ